MSSINLRELIERLEGLPGDLVVDYGFTKPHSWRGSYIDLAFEPAFDVSVYDMLSSAESAVGTTYTGWKGGEFSMGLDTSVHLAQEGSPCDSDGEDMLDLLKDIEESV